MKLITEAEYEDLLARAKKPLSNLDVIRAAVTLAADARACGVVLTITQRPLQPLAMGHHEDEVEISEVRNAAR